jgi:F-type H+-transporting ATPase subunit b
LQIDWITLAAQAVNFLVLLALLKFLVYDRVVEIMDRREQKIASRLREGREKREEAEKLRAEYQEKLDEIDHLQEKELAGARREGEKEKNRYIREARREVDEKRRSWEEDLEREKNRFLELFRKRTGEEVYGIARKALADLADQDLEKKVVEKFLEQVRKLEGAEKIMMEESGREPEGKVVVESSYTLQEEERGKIEELIKKTTGRDVEFTTSGHLICGINLYVDGVEAGWNIGQYIDDMEKTYRELVLKRRDPE